MRESHIKKLLEDFPTMKHRRLNQPGLLPGDWFFIKASPRPSLHSIEMVASDLMSGSSVRVMPDLKLYHSAYCEKDSHDVDDDLLKGSLLHIPEETFDIAIWEGNEGVRNGQPIAVAVNPLISYYQFPDHPHISASFKCITSNGPVYFPYSLCFNYQETMVPKEEVGYEILHKSLCQIGIWLFCHQVWIATRNHGKSQWISYDDVPAIEEDQFGYFRNPYLPCRCGSGRKYIECHFGTDMHQDCARRYLIDEGLWGQENFIDMIAYNKWYREKTVAEVSTLLLLSKCF